MQACKHLDYTEGKFDDCELIEVPGFSCRVRYWKRGEKWIEGGYPQKVQFCHVRGRINGIAQCYNPGEMPCYEAAAIPAPALDGKGEGLDENEE